MSNKLLKLADLLPDNISEDTFTKINELIASVISEEVSERMKLLEAKSVAFIVKNKDLIKQTALSELNEENEVFKDASQFRKLKSIMGVKKVNVSEAVKPQEMQELIEENKLLIEHLNSLINENDKYKKVAKKYKKAAIELTEQVEMLTESNTSLKDTNQPFKSSEKALILAEEIVPGVLGQSSGVQNEFLSESVMALMPKNPLKK